MARPRTPTGVLEAKGSFLKHPERKRARANEPKPTGELGDAPDDLSREEKAAWRYLASLLAPGVATSMDRAAMEEASRLRVMCKSSQATAAERQLYRNYLAAFGIRQRTGAAYTLNQAMLGKTILGAVSWPPRDLRTNETVYWRRTMARRCALPGNCSCYGDCSPCTQLVVTMADVRGWDRLPDGVILAGEQAAVSTNAALRSSLC
jgi:hypothetical protein